MLGQSLIFRQSRMTLIEKYIRPCLSVHIVRREQVIVEVLKNTRGVLEVKPLNRLDRETISRIEREYTKSIVKGIGRPRNLGVEESLKREHVVVIFTTSEFEWSKGPYAVIKVDDRVIGIIDEYGLKLISNRLRKVLKKGTPEIIFLPLNLKLRIPTVRNLVVAPTSPPTDSYLKKRFGIKDRKDIGTMLVGFDLLDKTSQ
ncbi:MAG: hypothetical protein DRJ49_02110 [Thermoprotei archaeon]|nr:MAG: hypothetical protein DRJ49_02110 [Thermoprotei archaeon]